MTRIPSNLNYQGIVKVLNERDGIIGVIVEKERGLDKYPSIGQIAWLGDTFTKAVILDKKYYPKANFGIVKYQILAKVKIEPMV